MLAATGKLGTLLDVAEAQAEAAAQPAASRASEARARVEAPAQAPALEVPVGFDALSDDLVLRALLRAPFFSHGSLHAVCHRFKSLLRSDAFRGERLRAGLAEHGIILVGHHRRHRRLEHPKHVTPAKDATPAECWLLLNGQWRPIPPMSCPRHCACSVVIDDEMWVMGGVDDGYNALATVEIYSPTTNAWRSGTPMSQRRADAVAGVVGGRLVVVGGTCDGPLRSAEVYTGSGWAPAPCMPHKVSLCTACVLNERLYVIGGEDTDTPKTLQVLEMTDERGLSWSRKADLLLIEGDFAFPCRSLSLVHEGRITLIGEPMCTRRRNKAVIAYDADADVWDFVTPLPFALHGRHGTLQGTTTDDATFLLGLTSGFEELGQRSIEEVPDAFQHRNGAWTRVVLPDSWTKGLVYAACLAGVCFY